ncbi:putative salicylate hydroxylase [Halenospora varia]|nr:putative salicylate hydroxylase [Halenospora varia]
MKRSESSLTVVIIGAGLGGLSAAIACRRAGLHTVILEQVERIGAIGAGIQIPPNGARVLDIYGLLPEIKKYTIVLDSIDMRRYEDGSLICSRALDERFMQTVGGEPWMVIHREDYHGVLLREAERLGSILTLGAKVKTVDIDNTVVLLEDGRRVHADVIIGADGLWSSVRESLYGMPHPAKETGDLAYRGTFPKQKLLDLKDERIDRLCNTKNVTVWFGPDKHCVFYPVRSGKEFNLVLLGPDNIPPGLRTSEGDIEEVRATFKGWDEILTKIISCIPSVLKWRLMHCEELEIWTKNRTALLGDACHPTLPYQAQGAAMAVEDGAVIGYLIGELNRRLEIENTPNINYGDAIQSLLQLYEKSRKHRTTVNVLGAQENRVMYHLKDGLEQMKRDAELKDFDFIEGHSNMTLANPSYQKDLLGFDALKDAARAFGEWWSGFDSTSSNPGLSSYRSPGVEIQS